MFFIIVSLIIAILSFINALMNYLQKKREHEQEQKVQQAEQTWMHPPETKKHVGGGMPSEPIAEAAMEGEDPCHAGQLRPAQPGVQLNAHLTMESAGEGEDPCHAGQLHPAQPGVRLITPLTMESAGEGEDPCHVGESPIEVIPRETTERSSEGTFEPAKQLLCGIIMSEVLKRPAERRMDQRLRRHM